MGGLCRFAIWLGPNWIVEWLDAIMRIQTFSQMTAMLVAFVIRQCFAL